MPLTPALSASGLRHFDQLHSGAIAAVTERFFATNSAAYAPLGPHGREACRDDLTLHLEFLRPALEFGLTQPMVDYLRWLATVLSARGVPARFLVQSLDWLAEYFAAHMHGDEAACVVTALQRSKQRYLASGEVLPGLYAAMPPPWAEWMPFEAALLAGDRLAAGSLVERALGQGHTLVDIELHVVQPALYSLGRKWQDNQLSVAQEHLATAISQAVMTQGLLRSALPEANGRTVLLACVAGNQHSLGLQMVADSFQLAGWQVHYLGANVPSRSLIQHVGETDPDLLGLSVAFAQQLPAAREVISQLRPSPGKVGTPVIVGGLAINQFQRLAEVLGADAWGADAKSAVNSAAKLATQWAPA